MHHVVGSYNGVKMIFCEGIKIGTTKWKKNNTIHGLLQKEVIDVLNLIFTYTLFEPHGT